MMSLHSMKGCEVLFWYPKSGENRAAMMPTLTPRRVRVESVRDTFRQPVSAESVRERPDLMRSRYLVTAWDLQKGAYRSFYSGSARVVTETPRYEVLVVDGKPEFGVVAGTGKLEVAREIAAKLSQAIDPLGARTLVTVSTAGPGIPQELLPDDAQDRAPLRLAG